VGAWSEYSTVRADLAEQREAIDAAWTQVDLALDRRAELLSKLLPETPGVADARAALSRAATPREKIQANARITELLDRAPRSESSATLQRLSDAENRLAVERRRYNEVLEHYNAQIQRFPDNIVAALAGFRRDDAYLPTEAGAGH
jgi:LemA protein